MKKVINILLVAVVLAVFSSCQSEVKVYENFDQMIEEAKQNAQEITADKYLKLIEAEDDHYLVDIRETDDYTKGHIPGAISVPRGKLEFSTEFTDRRKDVYLFSYNDGTGYLSAVTLQKMKYKNVFVINTSWEDWAKANEELIETGMGSSKASEEASPAPSGGCGG